MKKYVVELTKDVRECLDKIISSGTAPAQRASANGVLELTLKPTG